MFYSCSSGVHSWLQSLAFEFSYATHYRNPRISTRQALVSIVAVDHLNLTVAPGEIVGLVGPDGAGKTTTLRMLCGLLDPTEGSATVAGFDVARQSQSVKDQIGYMAQRFGLYPISPCRRTWISTPTCSAS